MIRMTHCAAAGEVVVLALAAVEPALAQGYQAMVLRDRSDLRLGLQFDASFVGFPRTAAVNGEARDPRQLVYLGVRGHLAWDPGARFRVSLSGALDTNPDRGGGGVQGEVGAAWFLLRSVDEGAVDVGWQGAALVPDSNFWLLGPRLGLLSHQWTLTDDDAKASFGSSAFSFGALLVHKKNVAIQGLGGADSSDGSFDLYVDGLMNLGTQHKDDAVSADPLDHQTGLGVRGGAEWAFTADNASPWGMFTFRIEVGKYPIDSGSYGSLGLGWGAATLHSARP